MNNNIDIIDKNEGGYAPVMAKDGGTLCFTSTDNRTYGFSHFVTAAGNPTNEIHLSEITENGAVQVTDDFGEDFANKLWWNMKHNPMSSTDMLRNISAEGIDVIIRDSTVSESITINGITFYIDSLLLTDDIMNRLTDFAQSADDKAYSVYLDDGKLVIY